MIIFPSRMYTPMGPERGKGHLHMTLLLYSALKFQNYTETPEEKPVRHHE